MTNMEDLTDKTRSVLLFEESFRSEKTKEMYVYCLKRFLKWAHKDFDSLLLLPSDQIDILLQDYVIYLKKRVSPNSLKPILASIDKFLVMNDKTYNKRKLKMLLPETVKVSNERAYTTDEVRKLLDYSDTPRSRALIHILASTGCRVGALVDFQIKHMSEMPNGSMAFVFYAGSKWEYTSFAHSEAIDVLKDYHQSRRKEGELLTDESYVFRPSRFFKTAKSKQKITVSAISSQMTYLLKKTGISRVRNGKRYDLAVDGGFRKRFNTILKSNPDISYAIAERLMEHRTNLESHYLDTPKEKLYLEYRKAIKDLMISDEARLKKELDEKEKQLSKESQKDSIITDLTKRLSDVEKILKSSKD